MSSFRIKSTHHLYGEVIIPPSKSHTLRALFFALMAQGTSRISHYLHSPDSNAMACAIRQCGARLSISPECIEVQGVGGHLSPTEDVIQAGNSGLVLRLMGALTALSPTHTIITGDESIRHRRPIQPLVEGLNQLGAFAVSARGDGYAPFIVRGPMFRDQAVLSGEDSQPISALLCAASFLPYSTTFTVMNPGEKPWIDLTLHWLNQLGIFIFHENYERYVIPGKASYQGFERTIPGDFSSAAYLIAAALLTQSEVVLHSVDMGANQPDRKFLDVLVQMGAKIEVHSHQRSLTVKPSGLLKGGRVDMGECIDMVTLLPVIACFAEGETELLNAAVARTKESDRLHAITIELRKMGASIEEYPEGLLIRPSSLKGSYLHSHYDHRMVLSLSVAALAASGESVIRDAQSIHKTYPTFLQDLQSLGASVHEENSDS